MGVNPLAQIGFIEPQLTIWQGDVRDQVFLRQSLYASEEHAKQPRCLSVRQKSRCCVHAQKITGIELKSRSNGTSGGIWREVVEYGGKWWSIIATKAINLGVPAPIEMGPADLLRGE